MSEEQNKTNEVKLQSQSKIAIAKHTQIVFVQS